MNIPAPLCNQYCSHHQTVFILVIEIIGEEVQLTLVRQTLLVQLVQTLFVSLPHSWIAHSTRQQAEGNQKESRNDEYVLEEDKSVRDGMSKIWKSAVVTANKHQNRFDATEELGKEDLLERLHWESSILADEVSQCGRRCWHHVDHDLHQTQVGLRKKTHFVFVECVWEFAHLLQAIVAYSPVLDEMTQLVLSSSIALTYTEYLDFYENNDLTKQLLLGIKDVVCAFQDNIPAVNKRARQILSKLSEVGISDEIELHIRCSGFDFAEMKKVFLGAQLVHALGANAPFSIDIEDEEIEEDRDYDLDPDLDD
ncbi:hypothetical protein BLNAU_14455 [Blattamonas nauphoetae]|uniref:Uncharacterized protein n=1 Tax=Blattamonas nauphoetae TaxID=2049346 RepID=A0ABQ9XIL1_9EUKA|nr:hypothetical protein BLNAU_14455 [Blattamonas nauphoetae]